MEYMPNLEKDIKEFLLNDKEELSLLYIQPINNISEILKKLGYEFVGQDTNGWQIDFDIYFENNLGHTLMLRGSIWYGNYDLIKLIAE